MSDTEDKQDDSEAEEKTKSERAKGKRKARDDDETEEAEPEKKGKRKATAHETAPVKPRSRGVAKTNGDAAASKPKKAKPASRLGSGLAEEEEDGIENDAAPKKKKRKINIFPPSQPTSSFQWGQLPQVSERL